MADEPDAEHVCPGEGHFPVEHGAWGWYIDTCGDGAIDKILFCPYCGVRLEKVGGKA